MTHLGTVVPEIFLIKISAQLHLYMRNPIAYLSTLLLVPLAGLQAADAPHAPYNVLFIAIDDMNDWVGTFGGAPQEQSATPQIDRFIANGAMAFQQANCAAPMCGPSRAALLSGFMPNRTGIYANSQKMMESSLVQTHLTLPEYFSRNGYYTLSTGKIFHKHPGDQGQWAWDLWNAEDGGKGGGTDPEHLTTRKRNQVDGKKNVVPAVESDGDEGGEGEGTDFAWGPTKGGKEETKDWKAAEWAVQQLAIPREKPFFLALGISKPHLPWIVPQEYFDRHPLESIKIPKISDTDLNDITTPTGEVKFKPTSDYKWVKQDPALFKGAIQGYLAASSLADDCVGYVLDALAKSPLRDNTIVVIWGDHGWHLGEKQRFRKFTLWAESTRTPLIIRVPGMTARQDCPRPVSLMDIYPTLIELCGLPVKNNIDGRSIAQLLREPNMAWPYPSITINAKGSACVHDERWYYIRYNDGTEEFYDMEKDPMQWTNIAKSDNAEIGAQKERLAKFSPSSFVPDVSPAGKDDEGEKEKKGTLDMSLRASRAKADLK